MQTCRGLTPAHVLVTSGMSSSGLISPNQLFAVCGCQPDPGVAQAKVSSSAEPVSLDACIALVRAFGIEVCRDERTGCDSRWLVFFPIVDSDDEGWPNFYSSVELARWVASTFLPLVRVNPTRRPGMV